VHSLAHLLLTVIVFGEEIAEMVSFAELRDKALACCGSNSVLSNYPETTGPIYPGLVLWPAEDGASPFWAMIGVSSDGRLWDIYDSREPAQLKCAICRDRIQIESNFQHAENSDCFRVTKSRLFDARKAFLRWAVVRVQLQKRAMGPDADLKQMFESLLVALSGTALGPCESFEDLLAWANGEFRSVGTGNFALACSRFSICEEIIHLVNNFALTLPLDVWQNGLFGTLIPPLSDIGLAFRSLSWWLGFMKHRGEFIF
jgi:hypothetical protein